MSGSAARILYVDDNLDMWELVRMLLRNFEVDCVRGMDDALQSCGSNNFDLFILDYHLSDGTGFDLCQQLRLQKIQTPILFITGSSSVTEEKVFSIGGQALMWKNDASFIDNLEPAVVRLMESKQQTVH
ncbi:MAG: response regulator [Acidobacteria bacterium]|nr:response regulator [Acidobacteriota bacterium]